MILVDCMADCSSAHLDNLTLNVRAFAFLTICAMFAAQRRTSQSQGSMGSVLI
jgi:hypothetical protein